MEDSDGKLLIEDGIISIRFNTHCGSGIGALGGRVGIDILRGDIAIFGKEPTSSGSATIPGTEISVLRTEPSLFNSMVQM